MIERRIKAAKFPATKSLDSFDFKAIASLNKPLVLELARCEYIDKYQNIIALGQVAPVKPMSHWGWDWPPARRAARSAS